MGHGHIVVVIKVKEEHPLDMLGRKIVGIGRSGVEGSGCDILPASETLGLEPYWTAIMILSTYAAHRDVH